MSGVGHVLGRSATNIHAVRLLSCFSSPLQRMVISQGYVSVSGISTRICLRFLNTAFSTTWNKDYNGMHFQLKVWIVHSFFFLFFHCMVSLATYRAHKAQRDAHLEVKIVKKLTFRKHFLKYRCPKIARRCGQKHIWK